MSFGLVSIPIEVFPAVRDLGPRFHFLRRSDKSPIGYQKVAKKDGRPVEKDELVKGFEYEKGRYVVLTEQDFNAAAVKRNSRVELLDFVPAADVDDRYFDKPYYLLPGRGGDQAYALLRDALRESERVGIAKVVMRNRPHLAAIEAIDHALVLSTLRFREELVPAATYQFPDVPVRKRELGIAHQLIEALAAPWDPEKYTDEYRANLFRIIEAKQKKQKPALERQEVEADAKVVDLMERLRQSLGQARATKTARSSTAGRSAKGRTGRQQSGKRPRRAAAGSRRKAA